MASFAGTNLGFIFSMTVAANPKGRQINVYPGANGLEVLDQGSRGGHTLVAGALGGPTPLGLAATEASLRSLQVDGGMYTLVDTLGTSWGGVILVQFQPVGRVYLLAGLGAGYARKYEAEFLHVF